jgi:hypothetical protein
MVVSEESKFQIQSENFREKTQKKKTFSRPPAIT